MSWSLKVVSVVGCVAATLGAQATRSQTVRFATSAGTPSRSYLPGVDPSLFKGLRYRMVGPNRGGRVTAVTGVPSQPYTFYMGVASGGVWKTTDAGLTWLPISDGKIPVSSVGAIEVSESDPNVVYVGTGSDDIRSNVSTGRGIYKSTDAGVTWTFVGLRDIGQVGSVRVDPSNPDLVYVAAIGNAFKPNPERGVYRSKDGGRNWEKVLSVSDTVGAAVVELKPDSPRTLYAWMWRGERKPWAIISGADASSGEGFYKSTDGGDHWTKSMAGLPNELIGKANIAVSAANPDRVYLLLEAKPGGGLYRSDDAGRSWTLATNYAQLITRPFYYVALAADPTNADVVYAGAEGFFKSTDGGKNFRPFAVPHGDNHDMWINPHDGNIMIQSNDGGANVSLTGGRTWSTQYNQPTAEIYQVYLDNQFPYRLYGAQQDNSTVIAPSLPLNSGQSEEWREGPGCETGPIMPHPTNPDTVYGSCKGQFQRMNLKTGEDKNYWVGAQSLYGNVDADLIYRFQRVSPMEISPWSGCIYYGSQYLHRTCNEGVAWARISPDLTANDPKYQRQVSGIPITRDMTGEEVYATLYAIRESTLERGVIWTGSNDGPFHVTRDDGKTWADVTPKDLPAGGRVQNIEPSPHRRGSAYFAVYRYLLGDFKPYIYRTDDYGKSWTLLTDGTNGIPADVPTRVVREDPDREGLLYAGTEFGMYISFDNGTHWQPFQLNLPVTPITDIKVHHKDLVLSTQGRSFWIMDDLTPLHQATAAMATVSGKPMLLKPRDAFRTRYAGGRGGGPAAPQYIAPGAIVDYFLPGEPAGPVTLDIMDAGGKVVRTFSSEAPNVTRAAAGADAAAGAGDDPDAAPRRRGGASRLTTVQGLNRFIWDLTYPGPWDAATQAPGGGGPTAVPGRFAVRLTVNGESSTQPLTLREDPRVAQDGVTIADLQEQFDHNMRVRDLVSDANRTVDRARRADARLRNASGAAADTMQQLRAIESKLITPAIRYSKPELQSHISYLYSMTNSADQKVGRDALERFQELRKELMEIKAQLDKLLGKGPPIA